MRRRSFYALVGTFFFVLVGLAVFWPQKRGAITIYVSTDEGHSKPILEQFIKDTGIQLNWEFDVEATKTVGLVNKLLEERINPRCDVFWNNEVVHTVRLANEGLLEPYVSPNAAEIPDAFKDPGGLWTGFAARARILIVNTEAIPQEKDRPTSMHDLLDPKWKGKSAFVRPLTGTTLTHSASLYSVLGDSAARAWLRGLDGNGVLFPPGNSSLAKSVALGQRWFGFTDTDDFRKVELEGRPVARVFPDQGKGQPGTMLIPNTVMLIKGGPETEKAKQLIDYILSKDVEARLAASDSAQIPLRADVARPDHVIGPPEFRPMVVDWSDVAANFRERLEDLQGIWGN